MDERFFVRGRPTFVRRPQGASVGDDEFLAELSGPPRFGAREYVEADEQVTDAGERMVHLPLLDAHAAAGFNYDLRRNNCVVRWANVPNGFGGEVDVVVHYHGYKSHNAMRLQHKADASGMDFDLPGVARPTLGLVPHGRAFVSSMAGMDGFSFPAIDHRAGLFRLIEAGMGALAAAVSTPASSLRRGRVILTGHSGGGAPLNALVRSLGTSQDVHGFQFYDATYGRAGTARLLSNRGYWLSQALERDARALQSMNASGWPRYMQERGCHFRMVFLETRLRRPTGTAEAATLTDGFIESRLAELVSDAALRAFLRRYYRAQVATEGPGMDHGTLPRRVGGTLLADPASDLSGLARDLATAAAAPPAPRPAAVPRSSPVRAARQGPLEARIGAAIDELLRELTAMPVIASGTSIAVHVPYFMNVSDPSRAAAATLARYQRADEQRRSAGPRLAALLREERFRHARTGKPTPTELRQFLQAAVDQGSLTGASGGVATAAEARAFLKRYGIGIDCSGFVSQALNRAVDVFPEAQPSDRIANVRSTGSAELKGDSARFQRVTEASDLRAGDTMWLSGHIRIVSRVEASSGTIEFFTAESRAGNDDVGPTRAKWRLVPDAGVQPGSPRFNFAGYRLERADDPDTSTPRWRAGGAHTYSHFRPLSALLQRARAGAGSSGSGEDGSLLVEDDAALGAAYRAEIVKALEYWRGAREGDEKFSRFRTTASLDAARKEAGKTGKVFTTCIEFLGKVQADAARSAGARVKKVDSRVCDPNERRKLPPGAWQAATRGSEARPKPGDIIFLVFARDVRHPDGRIRFGRGWFSHVGFFYRREALAADAVTAEHPAGTEVWYTIDGGQGTATRFDAQGNLISRGAEAIAEVRRLFHPPECLITGERIQGDADQRTLLGWVDVEKLITGAV